MTDPARQGSPVQERPEDNSAPSSLASGDGVSTVSPPGESSAEIPGWQAFARNHEWRRAQAAATLRHADGTLISALTALSAFQEDVRARSYAPARRALSSYRNSLSELAGAEGDSALLHSLAAPEVLAQALAALEQASGEADPAALQAKLAPAQAHPLTRAEAANAMGVLHALREETSAAQHCFEEALRLDGNHYRARMNLGNLALEAGDPLTAEAQYREVLKIAPDYDGAHHNLGVALRRQGKVYESVGAIRKAQRLTAKRSQQEARADVQEQLRNDPKLRLIRNVVLGVVALILFLLFFTGR